MNDPQRRRPSGRWLRLATAATAATGVGLVAAAVLLRLDGVGNAADAAPVTSSQTTTAPTTPTTPTTPPTTPPTTALATVGAVPATVSLGGRSAITVEPVGVAGDGALQIPDDAQHAGWWVAGAAPGDPAGTTVLVGHLDTDTGGLGAFAPLLDLPAGTTITLADRAGGKHAYRLVDRYQVPKAQLPTDLFTRTGPPRLVLLTCGGVFDKATKHYRDNVVVIADPLPAT